MDSMHAVVCVSFLMQLLSIVLQAAPTDRAGMRIELWTIFTFTCFPSLLSSQHSGLLNRFSDCHGLSGRETPYLVGWIVGIGSLWPQQPTESLPFEGWQKFLFIREMTPKGEPVSICRVAFEGCRDRSLMSWCHAPKVGTVLLSKLLGPPRVFIFFHQSRPLFYTHSPFHYLSPLSIHLWSLWISPQDYYYYSSLSKVLPSGDSYWITLNNSNKDQHRINGVKVSG